MKIRSLFLSLALLPAAMLHSPAWSQASLFTASGVNVRLLGAGNGGDDTQIFNQAVALTPNGGLMFIPAGNYRISGTIVVAKPITIVGTGIGSQVFEQNNQTLIQFTNVNGGVVRDIYLGSASTGSTSLLELVNSHHNRIDNVTMLGGGFCLHLYGSLLNTIVDLRSGTNLQGYASSRFFANTSSNQTWVVAEGYNGIAANANTFVAPVLEGGINGMHVVGNDGSTGNNGQGSVTITGGTIEGVGGTALTFDNSFLPSSVIGTHFEANASADILVNNSSNIRISAVLALNNINLQGDTRNVSITDSTVETVHIGPNTKRISVNNLTTGVRNCTAPFIDNQNTNDTDQYDGTPSVSLDHIGPYCYGQ